MTVLSPYNLAGAIFQRASEDPGRFVIRTMEDSVTYGQFKDLMISSAMHMATHGIDRSSRVAIDIGHPVMSLAIVLACSLLGCSWVRASEAVITHPVLAVTHLLQLGPMRGTSPVRHVRVDTSWVRPPVFPAGTAAPALAGYATPDSISAIIQSSGTTGETKFMALSEATAWRRATDVEPTLLPPKPVCAVYFPPLSLPGWNMTVRILVRGGTCLFGDVEAYVGRVPIDCVIGSPSHYSHFLDNAPPPGRKIPFAITSGAPARASLLERLLRYFDAVVYRYGSSEASQVCARVITQADVSQPSVGLGVALPGTRVQIVDETDAALPAASEGIIRIQSPWQVAGYIGEPELTSRVFRDGWFYPGDLGYLSRTGELFVTGRVNDQLNVGGLKLNPDTIDAVIQSVLGIRDGACFLQPNAHGVDQLAAAVCIGGPVDVRRAVHGLLADLRERFGPARTPVAVYVVDAVPRSDNGKIVRQNLAAAVLGHAAIAMPPE